MVRYELAIILRTVASSRLKESFKEAVVTILEEGALLRQLKNHGERQLPYRMKAHEQWHTRGRYVICDLEASPLMTKTLVAKIKDNKSTIRASLVKLHV